MLDNCASCGRVTKEIVDLALTSFSCVQMSTAEQESCSQTELLEREILESLSCIPDTTHQSHHIKLCSFTHKRRATSAKTCNKHTELFACILDLCSRPAFFHDRFFSAFAGIRLDRNDFQTVVPSHFSNRKTSVNLSFHNLEI